MSDCVKEHIQQQLINRGYYSRMITTAEAAAATGLSEYELRIGAKEGRYPVLLTGRESANFRRMRWNLAALEDAIAHQMRQTGKENK